MMRGALLLPLAGVATAGAATAHADPLPVVERAGDANLEPDWPHSGVSLTAALIASTIISADSSGDVGRGPGLSLRAGMAATPDTVVTIELTGGSMLHEHQSMLFTNSAVDFLLGAQYYAKPTLWFRLAGGIGSYVRRGLFDEAGAPTDDEHLFGVVALGGVGLDVLRRHKFVLGIEGFVSGLVERNGVTTTSGLGLAVSYN
jgi:hypothetical protein|nr:hypothetical protein [Kofleriaceae bacterium]